MVTRYVVVNLLALVQVNSTNPIFHLKSLTTNANISLFIFFNVFFFFYLVICKLVGTTERSSKDY